MTATLPPGRLEIARRPAQDRAARPIAPSDRRHPPMPDPDQPAPKHRRSKREMAAAAAEAQALARDPSFIPVTAGSGPR